jgi:hypothetical protein
MSTDVEARVRRALAGRAAQITPERLQPAVPPTAVPSRPFWRPWWRSLLVVAAVVVAVVFSVRPQHDSPPVPIPQPPAATVPASPEPSPAVSPSPAEPSPTADGSPDTTATPVAPETSP